VGYRSQGDSLALLVRKELGEVKVEMDEAIGSEPVMTMSESGGGGEGPERFRIQLTVVTDGWERRLIARHLDGAVLWDEEVARQATEAEVREFFRRFGIEVGWLVIEKRRALHPELAPPPTESTVEAWGNGEAEVEGELVALPLPLPVIPASTPVVLDESGELELPA
jgi:hypothetical protein